MSEVEIYLESLHKSFNDLDGSEAKRIVSQIQSFFKTDNLTELEIDSGITSLLNFGKPTVLKLIESNFMESKIKDAVGNLLELLSNLLNNYDKQLDNYVKDIVKICCKVLRSSCTAEIKLKAHLPLSSIVSNINWSQHVPSIAHHNVEQILLQVIKKNTPNVLNKELFLLGLLCEKHPEVMVEHSHKMSRVLMKLVDEDISSAKINFTAKEGMFAAVEGYMSMCDLSSEEVRKVYRCLKTFANPRDSARKGFARGAIKLLSSNPGKVFSEFVCTDLIDWLDILVRFVSSNNSDDRFEGCRALSRVYEYIGNTLVTKGSCDYTLRRLQHLMNYFKNSISDSTDVGELEYKLALEGFAVITAKCKDFIGEEEFVKVSAVLKQRAQLVLRDGDSVPENEDIGGDVTERMDKICMYIDALAALGSTTKNTLMDLVKALISDYPKYLVHKRNKVKFTLSKIIYLVDIQILVPFIVKESCKHCISFSLQYTNKWKDNRDEYTWTFEHFMDIWETVLSCDRGEHIFRVFIKHFLDTILQLDFSTKLSSDIISQTNTESEFEEIHMLNNPSEYSLFVNLCDLTSAILDFFASDILSMEWFRPWLSKILRVVILGLKINPLSTSLLKVAQSSLVVAEKLDIFREADHSNVVDQVTKILMNISINKSSGAHQLRSALFVLQMPKEMLKENILDIISEAIQVVLRHGRNDLKMITQAVNMLERLDSVIGRDSFRPVCVKVLPLLNDYLCSWGISDGKIVTTERSVGGRYEFASRRRRVLLTQGTSQHLEAVQHEILKFLGKMDSDTLQCLLVKSENVEIPKDCSEEDMEDIQLGDLSEKLYISLPCPEQKKIEIYLDSLIPRVKDLSLNSTNRDTRVTACQVLHSLILLMYGTHRTLPHSSKVSLTNTLWELTGVMVVLAADPDTTIQDMFDPLLTQSCHWFTSPVNVSSLETEKFLLALMKGAYHPSDSLVRDKACLALKEVIKWSIKQSSSREVANGPTAAAAIIRSICQAIVHPDAYRKRGGFLIFTNIVSEVYQIDSLIDKFLPEILSLCVSCINTGHTYLDKHYVIYQQEATSAINMTLKCLQSKANLFKKNNPSRRIPKGFGKSLLKDIVLWLLKQVKDCNCRVTANKIFTTHKIVFKQLNDKSDLVNELIMSRGFQYVAECYLEPDIVVDSSIFSVNINNYINTVKVLKNIISSVDTHVLFHQSNIMDPNITYTQENIQHLKLFDSVDFLLSLDHEHTFLNLSKNKLALYQIKILEDLLFNIYWKSYEMLLNIQKETNTRLLNAYIEKLCSSVAYWLFDFDMWIIMSRNTNANNHILSMRHMINEIKHSLDKEKWELFVSICESFKKHKFDEIVGSHCSASNLEAPDSIVKYIDDQIVLLEKLQSPRLYSNVGHFKPSGIFQQIFLKKDCLTSNVSVKFERYMMKFVLNTNLIQITEILNTLLNSDKETEYVNAFLKVFQHELCVYFIKHYVSFLMELDVHHNCDMTLVETVLKFIIEKKFQEESFLRYLTTWIIQVWPKLIERYNVIELREYLTMLAIALPKDIFKLLSTGTLRHWLLGELKDPEKSMEMKTKLTYLLAAVCRPSDDTIINDDLSQALNSITSHFPQRSSEFPPGSPERESYLSLYRALLETMANSGNFAIFKAIVDTSCVDKEHLCEEQIGHKVVSLIESISPHQAYIMLDWVYDIFFNRSRDPGIRLNLLNRFLLPMLRAASQDALEIFYVAQFTNVISKLDKDVSNVMAADIPLKHLFVDWNSSFALAQVMFSKLGDLLDSPESDIGAVNNKWRSLFSLRCKKIRNVTVPACTNQNDVLEYLRIARCAAYKCLHCIVTQSKDTDDKLLVRKYELLLDTSKDTLLWEGMIDMDKHYIFPLHQTCKMKYHTVRCKKSSNPDSVTFLFSQNTLSQTLMGGVLQTEEEKRKILFSQTLKDDILKYDFNMATMRDYNAEKIDNLKDQVVLEFEDTDLLNHEIMATVCCVFREMDKITCPMGEEGHITPAWVQHLAGVLGDRRRPRNIKLFLSQVMVKLRHNGKDIFKKYSSLFLKPLLNIIRDRCTTYNQQDNMFNFWDIGILLMVLSWRETAVPSTPDELESANFILKILIDQISPNAQIPELFKHTLEILKDLLNIWGKYLLIPSNEVISKLRTEKNMLMAGIQVTAVILASGCTPWQNDEQYEIISQTLIKLCGNSESKIYKPAAEVIGLMLKRLYKNTNSIDAGDVDMESKDYMRYVIYRDTVIKKLKEFKTDKSKFIPILYMISKHHTEVCDESIFDIMLYFIPKLAIQTKKICFRIFLSAIDVNSSSLKYSFKSLNLKSYLKDKDLGIVSLHIVNKLFDKVDLDCMVCYLEDICRLTSHKEKEVREVAYEILMKAYNTILEKNATSVDKSQATMCDDKTSLDFLMSSTDESRKRPFESTLSSESTSNRHIVTDEGTKYDFASIKASLVLGIEDEDLDLRKRLCDFWSEKLNNNLQERWLNIISEVCVEKAAMNQGCETERTVRLLLEVCKKAPDYDTAKLFNEPLENCMFMEYSLNSKRSQQSNLLAPMFAETINSRHRLSSLADSLLSGDVKKATQISSQIQSQLSASNTMLLNPEQRIIRATLDTATSSLGFDSLKSNRPGTSGTKRGSGSEGFSFQDDSSLLFTINPPLFHRKTYQPLTDQKTEGAKKDAPLTSELMLRRKLLSNKNSQKNKFAAMAIEKNIKKEQTRLTEKPAPIFRTFRKGDYPDIQISIDSVVAPLLGLATRDPIFSKNLFIVLFKSLLTHCPEESVNIFKESVAQCVVSQLKTRDVPLTVEALLEICRICLKTGSQDIYHLIKNIADNHGLEWLGDLVLEELAIDPDSRSRKRIKLEDAPDVVVNLPPEIKSQIKSLKWNNQWEELQVLYQDATANSDLGDIERLHCTEEYFNCFARLSDWSGFLETLTDHLTPENLLENDSCVGTESDLSLLWTSKYRNETYLHLVFMAYIQMKASVDRVYKFQKSNAVDKNVLKRNLESFNTKLYKWMDDPDKKSVLEGRMSPYVSLWRTLNGDFSVERCTEALKWLRQEWTRGCSGATCDNLSDILDIILTISESRNYLDLMGTLNSSRSNEDVMMSSLQNVMYSWEQCVPRPYSHTVAWDLRLACRSTYTCQLQNFIKTKWNIEEEEEKKEYRENLSKVMRRSELYLLKSALHQGNSRLARKLVEKHFGYVNDPDEGLPWKLECMRFRKLSAEREEELCKKIFSILDIWKDGESIRLSLDSKADYECTIGLLEVSAHMGDMLCTALSQHPWETCISILNTKREDLNTLVPSGATDLDKNTLLHNLIEYSSSRFLDCTKVLERDEHSKLDREETTKVKERQLLEFKAETYLKLVRYSRKAKQDYLKDEFEGSLVNNIILGILRGMRYGHMEARKLFPVLLLEMETLPADHSLVKLFMEEVSQVPCWMFLPWIGQILAHLPTLCPVILPLVTRMAQEYPAALIHHYQLSKYVWGQRADLKDPIKRLDQLLSHTDMSTLVKALGSLRCPWTTLKSYVDRLCEENYDKNKVMDELKKDLLSKDASAGDMKIQGQVFEDIEEHIRKLETLVERGEKLHDIKSKCVEEQNKLPERISLQRLSPYLEKYKKNVSDKAMEVFGQYDGFQNTPPDPKNHVTIVKFHPEVTIIKNSKCRPMRVSLYGSNGRKYTFLVKFGEDLRQDNRIQQVLDLMNHPLNQLDMHVTTYKVFPITQTLGVIEYVKDCATLKTLLNHADPNVQEMMNGIYFKKELYVNNLEGCNLGEKYGNLVSPQYMARNISKYREEINTIPGHFLRNSIQKIAATSEMFVKMKSNFIRTLAPMNVAHWILGIGDRHLSNCMMSLSTGNVVGIDFGHSFGTATQQLPVPELIPFRLTPQIRGVIGTNTDLSELMWQALSKLCENGSLLLAAMEVFVREPTLNWIKDNVDCEWKSRHKIDQCKRKLNGVDPITIIIEDLHNSVVKKKYVSNYCNIVRDVATEQEHLSVDQQIDHLIKLATNDGILSVTYHGWNSYF